MVPAVRGSTGLSLAAALARTTYHADGRLVVIDLPLGPDGRSSEADGDVALDVLRSVEAVEVALVVREIGPSRTKLSARSKGAFDVQKLAHTFEQRRQSASVVEVFHQVLA